MNILNTPLLQAAFLPIGQENYVDQLVQKLISSLCIFGALLYVIFAILIIRQIAVMKRTLITPFSPVIKIIGYVHFIIAIMLLWFYITIL